MNTRSTLPISEGSYEACIVVKGEKEFVLKALAQINLDIRNVVITLHHDDLPSNPKKPCGGCGQH